MNKTQRKPIRLDEFLEKAHKLHLLLESMWSKDVSMETRDNIKWYCDWRVQQYFKQYQLYLRNEKSSK